MRRMMKLLLCALLLCSGCTAKKTDETKAMQAAYAGYYKSIEENTKFAASSLYYSISAEMSQLPDGTYRYYVILDNPQIAMYDVVMMGVENNTLYTDAVKMMPCIGVFESKEYNLIPYQVYTDGGFVKGLVMSGEASEPQVLLKMLVEWSDKKHEKISREFLSMLLTPSGFTHPEDAEGTKAG